MKLAKKSIVIDISDMTKNNIEMLKFHLNKMGMKFEEGHEMKINKGPFGILLLLLGIIIMIAADVTYAILQIWEIQWGLVLGMIIMLVGMVLISIELGFKKSSPY